MNNRARKKAESSQSNTNLTLREAIEKYINSAFKGDRLELAVLLAMWLSFSMSEIRGLTKSNSIDGDYIVIRDVKIKLGKNDIVKSQGKVFTRNRMHHIPPYIKNLIDQVEGDVLVPYSADAIYRHFSRVLEQNHISHISFHKLRHMNASIMAMLNIPEKYAMECQRKSPVNTGLLTRRRRDSNPRAGMNRQTHFECAALRPLRYVSKRKQSDS